MPPETLQVLARHRAKFLVKNNLTPEECIIATAIAMWSVGVTLLMMCSQHMVKPDAVVESFGLICKAMHDRLMRLLETGSVSDEHPAYVIQPNSLLSSNEPAGG